MADTAGSAPQPRATEPAPGNREPVPATAEPIPAAGDRTLADYAERLAGLLTNAGFPRMPARVLMALMVAEGDGLTAHELAARLEVSAAAISNAVRYLQSLGMIRRVSRPGRRRDLYELPHHPWYAVSLGRNPFYDAGIALSEHALAETDSQHPAAARIAEMIDFFRFIQRRLPELMAEWRAGQRE